MQNPAQVSVHVVLVVGASLACKAPLWERLAHIAVGLHCSAAHQYLRAVVYLRYARQGQQYGERRLQGFQHRRGVWRIRVDVFYETAYVVVVQESHYHGGILIQVVIAEDVVDAVQPAPCLTRLLMFRIPESLEQRKVHRDVQTAMLHAGSERSGTHPCLANHVETRMAGMYLPQPCLHRLKVGIGVGVHAYAVNAGVLYPPVGASDEIFQQARIPEIQVGHGVRKPSVDGLPLVIFRCVRVYDSCLAEIGNLLGVGIVKPVLLRWVGKPRVLLSAVVEDYVHDNLQSVFVRLSDQCLVVVNGAVAFVYVVVVCYVISVIRHRLEDGSQPQCCHAEVSEIAQPPADAVDASVSCRHDKIYDVFV